MEKRQDEEEKRRIEAKNRIDNRKEGRKGNVKLSAGHDQVRTC